MVSCSTGKPDDGPAKHIGVIIWEHGDNPSHTVTCCAAHSYEASLGYLLLRSAIRFGEGDGMVDDSYSCICVGLSLAGALSELSIIHCCSESC